MLRDLIVVRAAAKLHSVSAHHLREVVHELVHVVVIPAEVRVHTDAEIVEADAGHALGRLVLHDDAECAGAGYKTQRIQRRPEPAAGKAAEVHHPHIVHSQLVNLRGPKCLGVGDVSHLRAPQS